MRFLSLAKKKLCKPRTPQNCAASRILAHRSTPLFRRAEIAERERERSRAHAEEERAWAARVEARDRELERHRAEVRAGGRECHAWTKASSARK